MCDSCTHRLTEAQAAVIVSSPRLLVPQQESDLMSECDEHMTFCRLPQVIEEIVERNLSSGCTQGGKGSIGVIGRVTSISCWRRLVTSGLQGEMVALLTWG